MLAASKWSSSNTSDVKSLAMMQIDACHFKCTQKSSPALITNAKAITHKQQYILPAISGSTCSKTHRCLHPTTHLPVNHTYVPYNKLVHPAVLVASTCIGGTRSNCAAECIPQFINQVISLVVVCSWPAAQP